MLRLLSIVYKSFRYRSISTYVSKSAESNALSLNSEPVLIQNMIIYILENVQILHLICIKKNLYFKDYKLFAT